VIHYITSNGVGNAWVANELSRVESAGLPFVLHAMRRPDKLFHASQWALKMNERTLALYPVPLLQLLVSIFAAPFLFRGRFFSALWNALFGKREHVRARVAGIAHFVVACFWARSMKNRPEPVAHIHSQWVSSCGTIGMYGAWLLEVPFSFTGHAADLFRERCALQDKIRRAEFIVCISEFHRRFYLQHEARPEKLFIAYCGIDAGWFYPRRQVAAAEEPYRILSSGRLIEKKGFGYLIEACRVLADQGERFECLIGGSGELEAQLRSQIQRLGLSHRVKLTGQTLVQEKIVEFMHRGDVYVLPCVWASDNDVDGLPQMLVEAMACGLPAISTRLVGIPDLIRHGQTGLLVEPNDAAALADAIARLMRDRALAAQLAEAGRQWVQERFNLETCLEPLIERYRQRLGLPSRNAATLVSTSSEIPQDVPA
jgi:colanic acid/amylovoran biosynthesis glycosyltransferase